MEKGLLYTYLICLLIDGFVDNAVGSLTDFLQDVETFIDVVILFDQTYLGWLNIILYVINKIFFWLMVMLIVSSHDYISGISLIEPAILLVIVNDIGYISQRSIWLFVSRTTIWFKMVVSLGLVHYVSGLTAHIFNNWYVISNRKSEVYLDCGKYF